MNLKKHTITTIDLALFVLFFNLSIFLISLRYQFNFLETILAVNFSLLFLIGIFTYKKQNEILIPFYLITILSFFLTDIWSGSVICFGSYLMANYVLVSWIYDCASECEY